MNGDSALNRLPIDSVPQHVGIIMDGNGRWAQARGWPRMAGHKAGVDNIQPVLEACVEFGIKALSIYAFSTENWRRPPDEVQGLMRLLGLTIQRQLNELHRNGVKIVHSGRLEGIDKHLQKQILNALEVTKNNTRITLNVAFNYGGRAEIADAVQSIMRAGIKAEDVTEALIGQHLYIPNLPDPDLIIRTGGDRRMSNFLLWQAAYAEFYLTATQWPDFGPDELYRALQDYAGRQRRFGGVIDTDDKVVSGSAKAGQTPSPSSKSHA